MGPLLCHFHSITLVGGAGRCNNQAPPFLCSELCVHSSTGLREEVSGELWATSTDQRKVWPIPGGGLSPAGCKQIGCGDGAPPPTCKKGSWTWSGLFRPLGCLCGLLAIPLLGLTARRSSLVREDFPGSIVCCWGCYGDVSWMVSQEEALTSPWEHSSVPWALAAFQARQAWDRTPKF